METDRGRATPGAIAAEGAATGGTATRRRWHAVSVLAACAALATATSVAADDSSTDSQGSADAADARLRVEVVGSHLRRTDLETSLPVQTITREEIDHAGVSTLAELMARVSANVNGFNEQLAAGAYLSPQSVARPGLSSVNLRGIGDSSTLVLVNGRRVANYAFDGGTVDIGAIPLAAIERVEVLKDGASAIYGTDAIAGVVNVVLRSDFRGVDIAGEGAWPEKPGGRQQSASLFAGTGDLGKDGYNAFIGMTYQKEAALDASQRVFSRTGYRPGDGLVAINASSFPANIVTPDGLVNPARAAGCAPPYSIPYATFCAYDPGAQSNVLPPTTRAAAYGRATIELSPTMQLVGEIGYVRNTSAISIAPTPYFGPFTTSGAPFLYPAGGQFYPTAFAGANGLSGDLALQGRILTPGNREDDVETQAWRTLIGLEGSLGGWDVSAALVYSSSREADRLARGYLSEQGLRDALATGLVNPFGPSGAAGDALIEAAQVTGDLHHAGGTTELVDAKASREFARLFGKPVGIALGVEARHERMDDRYAPDALLGDVLTVFERSSASGKRGAWAAFAEASVPLAPSIETQLAARYDHYSDFGGTTNPKVALRWQPSPGILARASWGTGFRAPTIYDLHTPVTRVFVEDVEDPVRCPVTGLPSDCLGSASARVGGNPRLKAETSEQFNAGIVWAPLDALSLTVDYWRIDKKHTIAALDIGSVLAPGSPWGTSNVVRGPVDPAYPNLPGPIQEIVTVNENTGNLRTSGYDVDALWRSPATPVGRFRVHLNGTYVERYTLESLTGETVSAAGNGDLFPMPRWRHSLSLDWSFGSWAATLAESYQSGYGEYDSRCDYACRRRVGAYDTWDVQVRYTGLRDCTLAAGIRNLFDRDPPFAQSPYSFAPAFDGTYADPRGRTYYVNIAYAFR